ncbi:MAG: GTP-binding protein [Eubacteriales bacterium]|nr:GTP-binding protein [Eubacteriales bacterium]MDN5364083.1 GTP-binding protein [Eubacteriales bacterium]
MKISRVNLVATAMAANQFPRTPYPEVAFAGRSNVGKSSLLNKLVNRKNLAHTSSSPGKTRTINFYLVNDQFFLVDLPGYGYAQVSKEVRKKWGELIENYLRERENLKGVVLLVDARHEPTEDDRLMYDWLAYYRVPVVVVATKADKISRGKYLPQEKVIRQKLGLGEGVPVLFFSARTGQGREELWKLILGWIEG